MYNFTSKMLNVLWLTPLTYHILDVPVQEKQKAFAEVELFGGIFATHSASCL